MEDGLAYFWRLRISSHAKRGGEKCKAVYDVQIREMERRKGVPFGEVREEVKRDLMVKEHQKVMEKWEDDLCVQRRIWISIRLDNRKLPS